MMPATAADPSSLMGIFCSQFAIHPVDASDSRIYALRHRVFCEELGYAMKSDGKAESDDYDPYARHFLLAHNGKDVGYVRVLTGSDPKGLPCSKFGFSHADASRLDLEKIDIARTCEASRLAILAEARRPLRYTDLEGKERIIQVGLLALYAAIGYTVITEKLTHMFMVGEPRLQKHCDRTGFHMRQGSEPFEYFGQRALFFYERDEIIKDILSLPGDRRAVMRQVAVQIQTERAKDVEIPQELVA